VYVRKGGCQIGRGVEFEMILILQTNKRIINILEI